jgi:hypothetical protein
MPKDGLRISWRIASAEEKRERSGRWRASAHCLVQLGRNLQEPYPLLQPTRQLLRGGSAPHSYSAGVRREAIQRANDCELSPLRRPASRPSTPICSSRSGHSIAYPSPSNCQCCRSAGDPCTRRGYHASGTTRLRPSARSTVNLSSVTFTCTATGSVSSTKVVMPRIKESCLVLHNKSRDTANLVCSKAAIGHKRHRLQPELGHVPITLHMDVRRFPAVGAEKMKLYGPSRSTVGIEPHC